ncbi:MAG: hypothetical protein KGO50_13225, partial [Myxococcales bacterium]|nr:hypothetical protein [Myxococcales bacterium]
PMDDILVEFVTDRAFSALDVLLQDPPSVPEWSPSVAVDLWCSMVSAASSFGHAWWSIRDTKEEGDFWSFTTPASGVAALRSVAAEFDVFLSPDSLFGDDELQVRFESADLFGYNRDLSVAIVDDSPSFLEPDDVRASLSQGQSQAWIDWLEGLPPVVSPAVTVSLTSEEYYAANIEPYVSGRQRHARRRSALPSSTEGVLDDLRTRGVDWANERVHQVLAEPGVLPSEFDPEENPSDGAVLRDLFAMERLLKLGTSDEAQALLDVPLQPYRSARDVVARGVSALETALGPDRQASARRIYRRAQKVVAESNVIAHTYADASRAMDPQSAIGASGPNDLRSRSPYLRAVSAPSRLAVGFLQSELPAWTRSSGGACSHCESALSPAAYLVDLASELRKLPAPGNTNLWEVLTARREDLLAIPLSCDATNQLVPYVGLVDDVLTSFALTNGVSIDPASPSAGLYWNGLPLHEWQVLLAGDPGAAGAAGWHLLESMSEATSMVAPTAEAAFFAGANTGGVISFARYTATATSSGDRDKILRAAGWRLGLDANGLERQLGVMCLASTAAPSVSDWFLSSTLSFPEGVEIRYALSLLNIEWSELVELLTTPSLRPYFQVDPRTTLSPIGVPTIADAERSILRYRQNPASDFGDCTASALNILIRWVRFQRFCGWSHDEMDRLQTALSRALSGFSVQSQTIGKEFIVAAALTEEAKSRFGVSHPDAVAWVMGPEHADDAAPVDKRVRMVTSWLNAIGLPLGEESVDELSVVQRIATYFKVSIDAVRAIARHAPEGENPVHFSVHYLWLNRWLGGNPSESRVKLVAMCNDLAFHSRTRTLWDAAAPAFPIVAEWMERPLIDEPHAYVNQTSFTTLVDSFVATATGFVAGSSLDEAENEAVAVPSFHLGLPATLSHPLAHLAIAALAQTLEVEPAMVLHWTRLHTLARSGSTPPVAVGSTPVGNLFRAPVGSGTESWLTRLQTRVRSKSEDAGNPLFEDDAVVLTDAERNSLAQLFRLIQLGKALAWTVSDAEGFAVAHGLLRLDEPAPVEPETLTLPTSHGILSIASVLELSHSVPETPEDTIARAREAVVGLGNLRRLCDWNKALAPNDPSSVHHPLTWLSGSVVLSDPDTNPVAARTEQIQAALFAADESFAALNVSLRFYYAVALALNQPGNLPALSVADTFLLSTSTIGSNVPLDVSTESRQRLQERLATNHPWMIAYRHLPRWRSERRNMAHVAELLRKSIGEDLSELWDADWVYGKILLDPLMTDCKDTSIVQAALLSIQLFVHRVLLGLEYSEASPAVRLNVTEEFRQKWTWLKQYRVWEANRRVFFFPENYLLPELRSGKSKAFTELEDSLLGEDLTDAGVRELVATYLRAT